MHGDLQKATNTLSYQHGVSPDAIIDLIVNEQEYRIKQQITVPEDEQSTGDQNEAAEYESIQSRAKNTNEFLPGE